MPNWKKVITSGSDASLNSLNITTSLTASGLIYPTTDGTDGQIIVTDGGGILSFDDNTSYIYVKNVESGTLLKGTPIHQTGTTGNTPEIVAASSSIAAKMPATFVLAADLTAGAEGRAVQIGKLQNVNTIGFTAGDNIYVGETGSYAKYKPQGPDNQIQNIATRS